MAGGCRGDGSSLALITPVGGVTLNDTVVGADVAQRELFCRYTWRVQLRVAPPLHEMRASAQHIIVHHYRFLIKYVYAM